ncbi:MAG: hypothetical protein OXI96_07785, partial [Acidimicrobiaceae bacterium]|nr:hypothetical protein [Acidimicrobiaceae bacterium]
MSRRLLTGKPVLWKVVMPLFVAAMIFASCGDDSETEDEPNGTTTDATSDNTLDSATGDMD